MRLYLLPISTRRTLLYAQRLNTSTSSQNQSYVDKAATMAAKKWSEWEKKESGWQRKVVDYGNHAFRRIPYQEWGLKSVPPLSARRRDDEGTGQEKVELVFPRSIIPVHKAEAILKTLATERQALHKKRLITSVVCMPLTIPFGLIPIIPNLPFFYLLYRTWSHWKAILGGKHVQWLIQNRLIQGAPSEKLDDLYETSALPVDDSPHAPEKVLLSQEQVDAFADKLEMPALSIELERAVWQVESALQEEAGKKAASPTNAEPVKTETHTKTDSSKDKKKE